MQKALKDKIKLADKDTARFVTLSCAEVERTAKTIMKDSPPNPQVTYGSRGHHPSYAGNPPVPDSGTLMQSVTHSLDVEDGKAVGRVGSVLKNPDYPRYLELGTSRMQPRPWLSASLVRCQTFMNNLFKEIFGK